MKDWLSDLLEMLKEIEHIQVFNTHNLQFEMQCPYCEYEKPLHQTDCNLKAQISNLERVLAELEKN